MSQRVTRLDSLFRGLALLSPLLFALLVVDLLTPHAMIDPTLRLLNWLLGIVISPFAMLISALILWRVPGNSVGRLLLLFTYGVIGWQFAFMNQPEAIVTLPYLLVNAYFLIVAFPAFGCIPLVFPDGNAYPRRAVWWIVATEPVAVIMMILYWLSRASSGNAQGHLSLIEGLRIPSLEPLNETFLLIAVNVTSVIMLVSIVSLLMRYRRSDPPQRRQIKWLAWGGGLALLLIGVDGIAQGIPSLGIPIAYFDYPAYLSSILIPLSIGAAILRNRLWDIDVIIRRTLIYSVVTGLMAVVYFGGVALMQNVFTAITGQESPLAIVASTLAIAALFTPLRNRVQAFVDRRFYRSKYDAEQTLEAFAGSLRDEVELEHLQAALMNVVEETLQPESIDLWVAQR
jgi:hypothetical protein